MTVNLDTRKIGAKWDILGYFNWMFGDVSAIQQNFCVGITWDETAVKTMAWKWRVGSKEDVGSSIRWQGYDFSLLKCAWHNLYWPSSERKSNQRRSLMRTFWSVWTMKARKNGWRKRMSELLCHAPFSSDLAPLNYFLVPNFNYRLGDQRFAQNEEVLVTVNSYFVNLD